MWETINNTLNGSWQTLLFVFATIIMIVILIKQDYLKIKTAHVKIGVDEKERAILRQQTEWTYQYVNGLYSVIMEKYPTLNPLKTRYILEKVYDEIVIWIMFNHITRSDMYLMVKQEKIIGLVWSMDIDNVIRTDKFKTYIKMWIKDIVTRLVDIREYYNSK